MLTSANRRNLLFLILSYAFFWLFSYVGYLTGDRIAYEVLFNYFGYPRDLYVFLFATVTYLSSVLFGFIGSLLVFLATHWLGRRLKVAVGKPTLYGFLLYLLTLLVLILNYNRTH